MTEERLNALIVKLLREAWGHKVADYFAQDKISFEDIEKLEDGYIITASDGETFNGLDYFK